MTRTAGRSPNSTFQGGPIEVFGGPWTITGNTVLGSTADTYSPGAFGLHSPHDVLIEDNQVSQSDPAGREFRLVILAGSGFDNTIQDNTFGGGAGQVGNELSYNPSTGQFGGINDPEVILAEGNYGVLFEGRPGAISADGRLLVLPDLRAAAFPARRARGWWSRSSPASMPMARSDMALAGQWFPVAQQVSLSGNTIELLMEDPLPAPPPGGYYVVEVTGGFVNNTFAGNTIDLTGKSSTGIKLDGEDYGTASPATISSAARSTTTATTARRSCWGPASAPPPAGRRLPLALGLDRPAQPGLDRRGQYDPGFPRRHPHRRRAWRQLLGRAGHQLLGDRARLLHGDGDREHIRVSMPRSCRPGHPQYVAEGNNPAADVRHPRR